MGIIRWVKRFFVAETVEEMADRLRARWAPDFDPNQVPYQPSLTEMQQLEVIQKELARQQKQIDELTKDVNQLVASQN